MQGGTGQSGQKRKPESRLPARAQRQDAPQLPKDHAVAVMSSGVRRKTVQTPRHESAGQSRRAARSSTLLSAKSMGAPQVYCHLFEIFKFCMPLHTECSCQDVHLGRGCTSASIIAKLLLKSSAYAVRRKQCSCSLEAVACFQGERLTSQTISKPGTGSLERIWSDAERLGASKDLASQVCIWEYLIFT